jgi:hypothetical protein
MMHKNARIIGLFHDDLLKLSLPLRQTLRSAIFLLLDLLNLSVGFLFSKPLFFSVCLFRSKLPMMVLNILCSVFAVK